MERRELTIDGQHAGFCDAEMFELAKMWLAEGRKPQDVARDLKASGVDLALTIVVNAKRALQPGSTGNV